MDTCLRVLLADTDKDYSDGMCHALSDAGYELVTVVNGTEVLASIAYKKPALIILNSRLPDICGFILCRRLKADEALRDIRIILVSDDNADSGKRIRGLQAGADVFLSKPVSTNELIAAVRILLQGKISEDALRESEQRYHTLLTLISDGLLVNKLHSDGSLGRILTVSDKMCILSGYSPEECNRLSMSDIYINEPEIDRSVIIERLLDGQDQIFEQVLRTKSGHHIPIEIHAHPFELDGTLVAVSLIRDISERKAAEQALRESEERFRRITASITDYIYTVRVENGKAIKTTHGPTCIYVTGYSPEEFDANPFLWITMVFEEDRDAVREHAQRVLNNFSFNALEHRIIRKDGSLRWVRNIPVPHYDAKRRLVSYDGLIQDVTERRRAQEELHRAQKLESLGVFAGGIAHDFNNLLGGLFGYIEMARDLLPSGSDAAAKKLDKALSAFTRARDLSQQLLTFSKGGLPVKKIVSLAPIIPDLCELALSGSSIRCSLEIAPDIANVSVDIGQLSQVMNNIILNARQAMPQGGVVTVRANSRKLTDGEKVNIPTGDYVCISIIDEGPGIPEAILPNIFDPFFSTKPHGSGLGLATSYSIIKNHGGYISVDTLVGKGTTFVLWLPVAAGSVQVETSSDHNLKTRGQGRILIMDDEELLRLFAAEILVDAGYETIVSIDGQDAVEHFKKAVDEGMPFDAVILDLTVPGGKGGEWTICELQKISPTVRAIVSSGYADNPILANPESYGFAAVITKPYKSGDLVDVVRRVVNSTVTNN